MPRTAPSAMAEEDSKQAFLHRWSRRKHEAEKQKDQLPAAEEKPPAQLPPVDQLTPESDFTGFMHPKVEDSLRRVALKKMFTDPHFNIPDPFEPYSGDWNISEPISEEMLATLNQARTHIFGDKKEEEKEKQEAEKEKQEVAAQQPAVEQKADEPGKQDA
ncbi:MAG: DUF3306 domain-containing protein [Panacagrimonas sp.]